MVMREGKNILRPGGEGSRIQDPAAAELEAYGDSEDVRGPEGSVTLPASPDSHEAGVPVVEVPVVEGERTEGVVEAVGEPAGVAEAKIGPALAEVVVNPDEVPEADETAAAADAAEVLRGTVLDLSMGRVPGAEVTAPTDESKRARIREAFGNVLKNIKESELLKTLTSRKFFGTKTATFLASMAGGAAVRYAVRAGLGAVTGGTGYVLAGAAGAISGGTIEGIKAYRKELKRTISGEEFRSAIKRKVIRGRSLKESISEEKRLGEKLEKYLALASKRDQETVEAGSAEKEALYQELKRELEVGGVRGKVVLKGALKGAAIGVVGGIVGSYLAGLFEHHFFPQEVREAVEEKVKGAAEEAVRETRQAGRQISEEALREKIDAAAKEAYAKTYERAVAEGARKLQDQVFSVAAERGEGLTHIARNLIHDYLVEQKDLLGDGAPALSREQLVYAEDLLRRKLEGAVEAGKEFHIFGRQIAEAIEGAQNLSEAQIKNLGENWVPRIREDTWERIMDYSGSHNAGNDFSSGIVEGAKAQAEEASRLAAEEAGKNLAQDTVLRSPTTEPVPSTAEPTPETPQPVTPSDKEAADEWSRRTWGQVAITGAAAAVTIGLGWFGWRHRGVAGRTLQQAKEAVRRRKPPLPGEGGPGKEEESAPIAVTTAERDMPEDEEAEARKRFDADPLIAHYRQQGIEVKPGDIIYVGIKPDAIGKDRVMIKEETVTFNDYSGFLQYLEGLTPHQRVLARRYKDDRGMLLGAWVPRSFNDKIRENPEVENETSLLRVRASLGVLPDEYRGVPGQPEMTETALNTLRGAVSELRDNVFMVGYVSELTPGEQAAGVRTLLEVLKKPSKQLENAIRAWQKKYFLSIILRMDLGKEIDVRWHGIEVDPFLTTEEMDAYLAKAIPTLMQRIEEVEKEQKP